MAGNAPMTGVPYKQGGTAQKLQQMKQGNYTGGIYQKIIQFYC